MHKGAEERQDVAVPVLPHHRGLLRQLVLQEVEAHVRPSPKEETARGKQA